MVAAWHPITKLKVGGAKLDASLQQINDIVEATSSAANGPPVVRRHRWLCRKVTIEKSKTLTHCFAGKQQRPHALEIHQWTDRSQLSTHRLQSRSN